jgi:hypothetical protein
MKTMCLSESRPSPVDAAERFASTEVLLTRVRLHGAVPEHAPVHPVKVEPALGVAVNRTDVPVGKAALHVSPQLMPSGTLVTVPVPVPEVATVS